MSLYLKCSPSPRDICVWRNSRQVLIRRSLIACAPLLRAVIFLQKETMTHLRRHVLQLRLVVRKRTICTKCHAPCAFACQRCNLSTHKVLCPLSILYAMTPESDRSRNSGKNVNHYILAAQPFSSFRRLSFGESLRPPSGSTRRARYGGGA